MSKITSIILMCVLLSSVYSLTILEEKENTLELNIHGQSSFLVDFTKNNNTKKDFEFELGRFSFEVNRKYKRTELSLITAYTENEFQLEQLNMRYVLGKNFSFKMGYLNVPFSRISECSDSELLMYNRNPLVEFCAPESRVGLVGEFKSSDGLVSIDLGAYNSEGIIEEDDYPTLDVSGAVHFMILGAIDKSESAIKDYEHLMVDISPGFNLVQSEFINHDDRVLSERNLYSGLHTAFRYSTLSVDAMFYHRLHDVHILDFKSFKYDGFSAHIAYAFMNKIEPSIRFTTNTDVLDYYYNGLNGIYVENEYRKNTIECSLNYYLTDLNSKFGIYYIKSTNDIDSYFYETDWTEVEELRMYMEFDIEKLF